MITLDEIQDAITQCLTEKNPNAMTCIKLASYYIIRDHLQMNNDFDKGVSGGDKAVLSEILETLGAVSPKAYDDVIRRLKDRE